MTGRRTVRALWGAVVLVVALLVLKVFVADAYRVASGSMRPTLFGGAERPGEPPFSEWVLVFYGAERDPRRFDLVVSAEARAEPLVKRVAGLPGESIQVVDGDLHVDGRVLPLNEPRPAPVVVFDDRLLAVEDYFNWKGSLEDDEPELWREEEGVWSVDALDVPLGSAAATMVYRPELRDDYFDADGRRIVGRRTVHDAVLECEAAFDEGEGVLRFELIEKGDVFELLLARERLVLRRRSPSQAGRVRVLLEEELPPIPAGTWFPLRFLNADDQLLVVLPDTGLEVLVHYGRNERHPAAPESGDQTIGHRVGFGAERLSARFRNIRILRDLHYTEEAHAEHGIDQTVRLGPDELFLLGDHSRISNDSRHLGPIPLADVLGRPAMVVWPLGRLRFLERPRPWATVTPRELPEDAGDEERTELPEPPEGSPVPPDR